jgi:CelD/BcsL family acetyltransferase involved in cellulose biosynthesis
MNEIVIELSQDVTALEADWLRLEAGGGVTAFQRYDYAAPLLAAFVRHGRAEPLIVVLREGAGGRPLMLLPLCRFREGAVTVIGFADLRVADYCAPLIAPDWAPEPAEFERLWRRIEAALPPCDIIRLTKLPETVGARPNPLLGLAPLAPYHVEAHGVAIAHPWAERAGTAIGKKQLGELRRNSRNIAGQGELRFRSVQGGPEAEAMFDVLFAQRTRRFETLGREDVMADPMWAAFYRDLVRGETARPYARMMVLTAADEPVASALGLVHDGAFLLLIPGFDMERFGKFGPGRLLIFHAMCAFAEEGLGYFDLTIGDEPYKQQFGVDNRTLFQVVRARSLRGRLQGAIWQAKVTLRRHPRTRAVLKRLMRAA